MNVYLNITVVDEEKLQDKTAPVVLTTINCDGVYRYWNADSIDEFGEYFWYKDYDGPANDDEVVELIVNGEKITDIDVFEDIVLRYGFDIEDAKARKRFIKYADDWMNSDCHEQLTEEEARELAEKSDFEQISCVFDNVKELAENDLDSHGVEDWLISYIDLEKLGSDILPQDDRCYQLDCSGRIVCIG